MLRPEVELRIERAIINVVRSSQNFGYSNLTKGYVKDAKQLYKKLNALAIAFWMVTVENMAFHEGLLYDNGDLLHPLTGEVLYANSMVNGVSGIL